MSELVTCEKCGGRYRAVQADGSSYTHLCPPARAVEPERRTWLQQQWDRLILRR